MTCRNSQDDVETGGKVVAPGMSHPQKTKIVYCADTNRKIRYPTVQFDFLGYTFSTEVYEMA
ncbi:MAG TPA: hypothetical protein VOA41_22030 [Candidatus Dormibacteraeota bacterium]|nr:hypothetical protein [Candidatus Dormibacteraeota bacterium]